MNCARLPAVRTHQTGDALFISSILCSYAQTSYMAVDISQNQLGVARGGGEGRPPRDLGLQKFVAAVRAPSDATVQHTRAQSRRKSMRK